MTTETAPTSYSSTVQKYTYDSKGNVLTDTAPNGRVTTYTYDSTYNHLLSKTYQQDEDTTIKETNTLTASKKSISQTVVTSNDIVVGKTKNTYNTKGQLLTKKSYSSDDVYLNQSFAYGGGAQVTKITTKEIKDAEGETVTGTPGSSAGNLVETFTYNDRGWLLTQTDRNGNMTAIDYDGTGRITQVTYPDGGQDTYVYDTVNNTVSYTNANDQTVIYRYDHFGNMIEVYDEETQSVKESYKYDSFGNRILETIHSSDDSKDTITYYHYDSMGRLIESGVRNSDGTDTPLETFTYTANTRKTTHYVKGSEGAPEQRTITTLDKMGNVTQIGRRLSGTTYNDKYSYDYLGNQINNQTTYSRWKGDTYTNVNTYDYRGNLLTSQDAQGNTITDTYDLNGNLLTTTDAKGNVTAYTYDTLGRMLTATTPIDATKSSIVKYTYDPNGNVIEQRTGTGTAVTDGLPSNFTTIRYTYDSMNRLTSVEEVIDSTTSNYSVYTYDPMGNLLTSSVGYTKSGDTISGTPSVTTYTYDQSGNVLTMTDPLGKTETYTYDINRNVLTKTDRNGTTTTYTYDNRGRLTQEVIGSGDAAITRNRTYGLNGSLLSLNEGDDTISYVYDEWGRVTSETNGTQVKSYTYDRGNLRTSFTLTDGETTLVSNTYTYDNLSRMTGVTGADGTTAAYTYDANDNLSTVTEGNGIVQTYTYNKANQITNLVGKKGSTTVSSYAYTYDLAGRRISAVDLNGTTNYTYDPLGRLTSETGRDVSNTYTYDARGNRATSAKNGVSTTYTYDLANRLTNSVTSGITTTYTYDDNGNTLTAKEGSNAAVQYTYNAANQQVGYTDPNESITATYSYNPDGLRKAKTVNGTTVSYGWDGDDIVVETTAGTPTMYVRGLQLVSNNTGTTTANAEYYLYDGHGNVTYLANNSGTITDPYRYDAFGTQLNTADDTNPFQYCGEYLDAETGNYYLRARNYVPSLGRFLTEDTAHDGRNWYVYCANNPIMYIDPSGNVITQEEIDMYENGEMAPGAYTYLMLSTYGYYLEDSDQGKAHWQSLEEAFRKSGYSDTGNDYWNGIIKEMPQKPIGKISKEEHYFRNKLNIEFEWDEFERLNKNLPENLKWRKLPFSESVFHKFTGLGNVKYVSACEHFEVVFTSQATGHRLLNEASTPIDMGTYNYYGPSQPGLHTMSDVLPWSFWGNSLKGLNFLKEASYKANVWGIR